MGASDPRGEARDPLSSSQSLRQRGHRGCPGLVAPSGDGEDARPSPPAPCWGGAGSLPPHPQHSGTGSQPPQPSACPAHEEPRPHRLPLSTPGGSLQQISFLLARPRSRGCGGVRRVPGERGRQPSAARPGSHPGCSPAEPPFLPPSPPAEGGRGQTHFPTDIPAIPLLGPPS